MRRQGRWQCIFIRAIGLRKVLLDKVAHANEERYGYSINMSCKESVESWIDDKEV